jgi:DNA mismatch endonuclease (patch repair protein)
MVSEKRSYIMSQIKSKNTKPEILVRKFLHAHGLRFRLHDPTLPGKPDLVFPKLKTVIFVHGCFWHGHSKHCNISHIPKTRKDYWILKIQKNVDRAKKQEKELKKLGYTVIVIWECQLKSDSKKVMEKTLKILIN